MPRDRNGRNGRRPRASVRPIKYTKWLICCEGRSEILYLQALVKDLAKGRAHGIRFGNADRCKPGERLCGECGRQHLSLYSMAQRCAAGANYDRVWIVFDEDAIGEDAQKKKQNFVATIQKCKTDQDIYAAWSIPCFEFFLALHSGNFIEARDMTLHCAKVKEMMNNAQARGVRCQQACQKQCKKVNAIICEKSLEKPYYNSFYALGEISGTKKASQLARKAYSKNNVNGALDKAAFSNVTACTNFHLLIDALEEYFSDL